jgi:hypothetical protein
LKAAATEADWREALLALLVEKPPLIEQKSD